MWKRADFKIDFCYIWALLTLCSRPTGEFRIYSLGMTLLLNLFFEADIAQMINGSGDGEPPCWVTDGRQEEARRLRLQADKEDVHVYLRQRNVKGHPNSRFLTATVLGVQQANRAVEVSEMWRAREKELALEAKLKNRAGDKNIYRDQNHHADSLQVSSSSVHETASINSSTYCSSSKCAHEDCYSRDEGGLRDDEVEEFLYSRAKRGRGAIGSRMDEAGPYVPSTSSDRNVHPMVSPGARVKKEWEHRVLGLEELSCMKSREPPKIAHGTDVMATESSKKDRSKERRSTKEKSGKRKRREKSFVHRSKSRRRE